MKISFFLKDFPRFFVIAAIVLVMPQYVLARPTAAIVYPNEAKITEHVSAQLVMENDLLKASFFLPIHALRDTLTVDPKPAGTGMTVSSVNIREQLMPYEDEAERLKNQLKALKQETAEHEARVKAAGARIDFWRTQAGTRPEAREEVESMEELGRAIGRGITDAYEEIFHREQSLEELAERIREVEKQLNALTGAARKRREVTVYLSGPGSSLVTPGDSMDFICSYHIRNTGWRPAYTINALPSRSLVNLQWYAEITQNTGVEWDGVDLKIATARVVMRPDPPHLREWIIEPRKPPEEPLARKRLMSQEAAMAPAVLDARADTAGAEPPREAGFTFDTYDLGRHSIRSGETRRITIRDLSLKFDYKYLVRPVESPQAFLFARIDIEDDEFIRLPHGDATFLMNSAFIANRKFIMEDKGRKLFFGPDPQVDIKLITVDRTSGETGFLKGKKHYRWGWKVSINNHKDHEIDVLMEDAAPQIRDDRIKLKEHFEAVTPEKEDNALKWTFSIPAQAERAVEYGFSITYPDDMTLYLGGR